MKYIFIIVLFASMKCLATNWTNSDSDLPTLQTAMNGMNAGDTMYITNIGTANWSGILYFTNVSLIGEGIDQSIIQDTNATASPLVVVQTSSNYTTLRISGFTFRGVTNVNNGASSVCITINGTCHSFRFDHVKFNLTQESNLQFNNWIYGVVDHCTFWRQNVFGVQVHHDTYGGGTNMYGDGSWADSDMWGTTNALYIESCVFTNNYTPPGMFDAEDGARWVYRYNYATNDSPGFHGTETGQRLRSARLCEFYNNTNYWDTNAFSSGSTGFVIRGGTLNIFSNFWYNYKSMGDMITYRASPGGGQWIPWLNADGFNGWDTNVSGSYPSGTATSTTTNLVVDSSKSWSVNQWATNVGAYVVEDTTTGNAGAITTNGPTTLYFVANHQGGNTITTSGDSYKIGYAYQVLDQPGMGQGHLIADTLSGNNIPYDTLTGKTNWSETTDPIYEWSNSIVMPLQNPLNPFLVADYTVVITNIDYVDGAARPGYTPLVFPHPLVSGIQQSATNTSMTVSNATVNTIIVTPSMATMVNGNMLTLSSNTNTGNYANILTLATNRGVWTSPINLSCCSLYDTNVHQGVLLTPNTALLNSHYLPNVGDTETVKDTNGNLYTLFITNLLNSSGDLVLGQLNSNVPPSVVTPWILPADYTNHLWNHTIIGLPGFWAHNNSCPCLEYFVLNYSDPLGTIDSTYHTTMGFNASLSYPHGGTLPTPGDSGSPAFIPINNLPVLLGVMTSPAGAFCCPSDPRYWSFVTTNCIPKVIDLGTNRIY